MKNYKLPQGWVECEFEDLLQYIQPTKYIVNSTNYDDNYKTPVLTAGKSFILGYTNEVNDIFTDYPVIIFDDFTTATKYVDFPFKVKSSAMKILKPYKYVNLLFLYYLMQTIHHNAETHKRYWISEYAKRKIPFPPFNEQMRIVEKIESEFAKIDEGLEHLQKAKEQLKQYRQSVLKSAFNNCSSYLKVGELCEVVRGGSPRPAGDERYYNGHIPFLKVADITKDNNKYLNEFTYTIKEAGLKKTRFVDENTLLLSNSGATLGVPKICTFATTFNDGIAAFLGLSNDALDFHYYYWLSRTKELRCINQGAAQPNLNTDIIKEQLIPNFDKFEQKKIVEEIEKRFAVADEVEKVVKDNIEKVKQLKQSILKKAFEGRLVPQDPTDEPASILLEKIKQERSKNAKI